MQTAKDYFLLQAAFGPYRYLPVNHFFIIALLVLFQSRQFCLYAIVFVGTVILPSKNICCHEI